MAQRTLAGMFPEHFATLSNVKRVHAEEYGWPERLTFPDLLRMYRRNGLAAAAVNAFKSKTWQDVPVLRVTDKDDKLSSTEEAVAAHLARIRFWQQFAEADARSIVGDYGGLVLRFSDDKNMNEPLDKAVGITKLFAAIPCWQHQLRPAEFDTDTTSETYGEPTMWEYSENAVGGDTTSAGPRRRFKVHPDRVLILSRDGTINDRSQLEAGYNAMLDAEKISGAGAEGFFKTAKNAPVISMEEGNGFEEMARGMGIDPSELTDKLNDVVKSWSAGFDASLLLSKMKTEFPNITLPQPEEFWNICVMTFSASMRIPFKVLIGMITGERASTEDAKDWARTNEARRSGEIVPAIMTLIERFQKAGTLPAGAWRVEWTSLLDDGPDAMMSRAKTMSEINTSEAGEVFDVTEIRRAAGHPAGLPIDDDEGDEDDG